ncbi:MFS transporter [Amycolatopsis sp. OK19-0408]|uniref:MFS transporter n=1 Tax=Amycolatopsis iheyensis TaxID=2945988 RepID=A0A9X2NDG9_9PSEU|nr:MFS transporter [Amycolatopsis iheyensis]MCR6485757.1 MFS transporter [Amycolatopsis iheyensis]
MSSELTELDAPRPEDRAPKTLWRQPDFLKLWAGQSLSLIGSEVTVVALPLVAVAVLHATTAQMGVLTALGRAPYILILFVGVWVDRVRRRPLLAGSDLGRALLLASVPIAYFGGQLGMGWLFVVMLLVGFLTVIFDVAWAAYLPFLVDRRNLAEGNSKLQLSMSTAEVAGPGLTAILLRWLSAATVVLVDVVSFLVSAVLLVLIRKPEEPPSRNTEKQPGVLRSIRSGLRLVWTEPLLRPTLLSTAFFMFFVPGIQALYFVFTYRELHLSASTIAVVLTLAGPGAIVGSILAPRLIKKIGLGRMCVIAALGGNTSYLLVPLAGGPPWLAVGMLGAAQVLFGFTMPLGGISVTTIRQAITPDDMQGRVAATFRAFGLGLAPFGALAAGFAGDVIGLRTTILVGAVGVLVPIFFLLRSPLPKVRGEEDLVKVGS